MEPQSWLNYHHLFYFKTIAIEGGIAKAADKLLLGQPTLSTQMKLFEKNLGFVLFDRSKRKLQLTEAGRLVLRYAIEIFRLGDDMRDALSDRFLAKRLQLHLGVMETVPKHLSLRVFHRAQKEFDCVVSITEKHDDELMRDLRAHRIDLVIGNHPLPLSEAQGFFSKSIVRMPIVVCGAPKYSHLAKEFPESIQNQPFIMPGAKSKLRYDLEHFLTLSALSIRIIAEVRDTSLQKLMAIHGDGLMAVPLPAVEDHIAAGELVKIGELRDVIEELWLIAAHRRIANPVAAAIMKDFQMF